MSYHRRTIFDPPPENRANVFVPPSAPQYQTMVDRTQKPNTDPLEWRYDEKGRPGVWVVYNWLFEMAGARQK